MTTTVLIGGSVVVVAAAVVVVASQPRRLWRDAAEHRQSFWLAWALGWSALGAAGLALAGSGAAGCATFVVGALVGGAQPSMIADVRDVRRLGRLRRRQSWLPSDGAVPSPAPIRWRAVTAPPHLADRSVRPA